MTVITLRAARLGDLDRLLAIEAASFASDRLSRRSLRRLVGSPSAACRVARAGREIAGYALVLFRRTVRAARLYSVAVDAAWRGHGVATRLLRDAERVARARGARALRLEVRTDNAGAIRLYERLGYVRIGRYPGYYADGTDALRFEKGLGRAARPPR